MYIAASRSRGISGGCRDSLALGYSASSCLALRFRYMSAFLNLDLHQRESSIRRRLNVITDFSIIVNLSDFPLSVFGQIVSRRVIFSTKWINDTSSHLSSFVTSCQRRFSLFLNLQESLRLYLKLIASQLI